MGVNIEKVERKKLRRNVLSSVIQVVLVAFALFVLYRVVLREVGAGQFGVWSLVVATSSLVKFANLGVGSAITRYIAIGTAKDDSYYINSVFGTSWIITVIAVSVACIFAYSPLKYFLTIPLSENDARTAVLLLPITLLSIVFSALFGVLGGVLEGFKRTDVRSYISILSTLIMCVISIMLLPDYGILALAIAQVFQYAIASVISTIAMNYVYQDIRYFSFSWGAFREIFSFSVKFQFVGMISMSFEPTTKWLLTFFSGPVYTGYYELGSRLVLQVRSLIVLSNQAIVPFLVSDNTNTGKVRFFENAVHTTIYFTLIVFSILIAVIPLFAWFWVGSVEYSFMIISYCLILSWAINTIASTAYFAFISDGEMGWNIIAQIATALINIVLGFHFGSQFGWLGVVTGWVVASTVGSIIIIVMYWRSRGISIKLLISRESFILFWAFLVAGIMGGHVVSSTIEGISMSKEHFFLFMLSLMFSIYSAVSHSVGKALFSKLIKRTWIRLF